MPTCAVDHRLAGCRNRQDSFYNRAPTKGLCKLMASACKQIIPPRALRHSGVHLDKPALRHSYRGTETMGKEDHPYESLYTFRETAGEAPCPSLVMSSDDSLFHAKVGSRVGI